MKSFAECLAYIQKNYRFETKGRGKPLGPPDPLLGRIRDALKDFWLRFRVPFYEVSDKIAKGPHPDAIRARFPSEQLAQPVYVEVRIEYRFGHVPNYGRYYSTTVKVEIFNDGPNNQQRLKLCGFNLPLRSGKGNAIVQQRAWRAFGADDVQVLHTSLDPRRHEWEEEVE